MMFQLAGRMRWADVSLRLFTNEVLVRAKACQRPAFSNAYWGVGCSSEWTGLRYHV